MKHLKISFFVILMTISTLGISQNKNEFTRKGFVISSSLGGGLHFLGGVTYGRFSAPNLKIGAMLNQNLGFMLYLPGGSYKPYGKERAFEGFIPSVQFWFTENLYINAGAGLAVETTPFYRVNIDDGPPEFNTGLGLTFSVGKEVIKWSHNKAIDVQLRFLYGSIEYSDSSIQNNLTTDLLIGFNLY